MALEKQIEAVAAMGAFAIEFDLVGRPEEREAAQSLQAAAFGKGLPAVPKAHEDREAYNAAVLADHEAYQAARLEFVETVRRGLRTSNSKKGPGSR